MLAKTRVTDEMVKKRFATPNNIRIADPIHLPAIILTTSRIFWPKFNCRTEQFFLYSLH